MWGFPWMVLVLLVVLVATRRRRWERWAMTGPGWGWRYGRPGAELGAPLGAPWWREGADAPRLRRELEQQRDYAETLERRIEQLEERLDFTERLLTERRAAPRTQ